MRLNEVDLLSVDDRNQREHGARVPVRASCDEEDASARRANALDKLRGGRADLRHVGQQAVMVGQLQQAGHGGLGSANPETVGDLEHATYRARGARSA
jgi:hypothetical protein